MLECLDLLEHSDGRIRSDPSPLLDGNLAGEGKTPSPLFIVTTVCHPLPISAASSSHLRIRSRLSNFRTDQHLLPRTRPVEQSRLHGRGTDRHHRLIPPGVAEGPTPACSRKPLVSFPSSVPKLRTLLALSLHAVKTSQSHSQSSASRPSSFVESGFWPLRNGNHHLSTFHTLETFFSTPARPNPAQPAHDQQRYLSALVCRTRVLRLSADSHQTPNLINYAYPPSGCFDPGQPLTRSNTLLR